MHWTGSTTTRKNAGRRPARRQADQARDIPLNLSLPPSRSVPGEPLASRRLCRRPKCLRRARRLRLLLILLIRRTKPSLNSPAPGGCST